MRIDTEELLMALHEVGIDTSLTVQSGRILVQITNMKNKVPLAIATDETIEKAFAIIMRKLADDSVEYKKLNSLKNDDRLSIL